MDNKNRVFFELRAALPTEEILTPKQAEYARQILEQERLWKILPLPKTDKTRFKRLIENYKLRLRVFFSERIHKQILDGKEVAEIIKSDGNFNDLAYFCVFGNRGLRILDQYERTHLKKWVREGCHYPHDLTLKALFERCNNDKN